MIVINNDTPANTLRLYFAVAPPDGSGFALLPNECTSVGQQLILTNWAANWTTPWPNATVACPELSGGNWTDSPTLQGLGEMQGVHARAGTPPLLPLLCWLPADTEL